MSTTVCIPGRRSAVGGPGSFQRRMSQALEERGIGVTFDLDKDCDVVLVIGGTRRLPSLYGARSRGVRVVQRLDGINWLHRTGATDLRYAVRAIVGNFWMSHIYQRVADAVVFQSRFIERWLLHEFGPPRTEHHVIHNAVDTDRFTPGEVRAGGPLRILGVEGVWTVPQMLRTPLALARELRRRGVGAEITLVGHVPESVADAVAWDPGVVHLGVVPEDEVLRQARQAHLFLSCELQPPCPNSVIEALACGLPILGYDSGSLRELAGAAGVLAPFHGNPWTPDRPSADDLADATVVAMERWEDLREKARTRAVECFSLDRMVEAYVGVLFP